MVRAELKKKGWGEREGSSHRKSTYGGGEGGYRSFQAGSTAKAKALIWSSGPYQVPRSIVGTIIPTQ